MKPRKVFNHLHQELSLMMRLNISRMDLWSEVGDPMNLTHAQAVTFLEEEAPVLYGHPNLGKVTEEFKRWNPRVETPEEIMERICTGL